MIGLPFDFHMHGGIAVVLFLSFSRPFRWLVMPFGARKPCSFYRSCTVLWRCDRPSARRPHGPGPFAGSTIRKCFRADRIRCICRRLALRAIGESPLFNCGFVYVEAVSKNQEFPNITTTFDWDFLKTLESPTSLVYLMKDLTDLVYM